MKSITAKDLRKIGWAQNETLGKALACIQGATEEISLEDLKRVYHQPQVYLLDACYGEIAAMLLAYQNEQKGDSIPLAQKGVPYTTYGAEQIEVGARNQMDVAMRLPITQAGALMPDAHQGYGLPIGGVLATNNAVIPYGVGVDIGCRMALSVFDMPGSAFMGLHDRFKRELIAHTKFGAGHGFVRKHRSDHEILNRKEFEENTFIKQLKDKAWSQLGTSGGGNHFVEFGILSFAEADAEWNLPKGEYVALLTHSGSRGLGATIAGHYTKLAKAVCKLPDEAKNLAYLDLNTDLGMEYWTAMTLAGDYASACHEIIHQKLTKALGLQTIAKVENHHNFAWKEKINGASVIVHRKGATPAGKGVLGIIPGSMTAPGFVVRGKGEVAAIHSASHGAGRQMSRTQAKKSVTQKQLQAVLKDHGVTLIGAGLDEAPFAYKDIHKVMAAQKALVDIVATFTPKMVRMADDGSRED
ncbi:MAG: RtcB family protein [Schleiferiaceae bacterium]|nr:RtcB family protein [Schleiferiaceae bacterium]